MVRYCSFAVLIGWVLMSFDWVATAEDDARTANYQRPPKAITDILDAPPTPQVSLSPTRNYLLLVDRESYPSIAEVSAPMLRLAGERIDARTNGPHLPPRGKGLTLQ